MIAKRFAAGARFHGAAAPDCSIMRAHMSAVVNAAAVDKRKVGLLAVVYASQGIGPGFAVFAMPVLLLRAGLPLKYVGAAGGLLILMAFKFVFGPWSDRIAARGQTRVWMSSLQIALAVCFVGLMVVPPERGILPFIALVAAAYLVVALLDVITDGLAVRMLSEAERPLGNSAQYGGYYGGSILSGGLFLAVEPRLGWGPAVSILALLVAAGWAAARALPDAPPPALDVRDVQGGKPRASVLAFLLGPVARYVLPLLLLLDMPQNVGIAMVSPFLLRSGLTQVQVGLVAGTAGLLAAVAGALLGGVLLTRMPRIRALMVVGVLQALSLFGFLWLATLAKLPMVPTIVVVCVAFGLASAFNIALSSWFMDQTSSTQPATDYSVMACAHTATFAIANPIGGALAAVLGFPVYFAGTGALALLLVLAAWPWLRRRTAPRVAALDVLTPLPGSAATAAVAE